jgi:pimeloyl-ACP methyl ester carboxylesterase
VADAAPLADAADGGTATWFERFVDFWNGTGTWAGMPEQARAAFLRVGRKVYLEVRSLLADRTPASAYAAIGVPALLLTGERTPAPERRVVQRLSRTIANARMIDLAGAGHMGPITHAELVNEAIATHIANAP